jgi:arginyl-tRNA synthetase
LASQFNSYYHIHRVISDNNELTKARLLLVSAIKQVFADVLGLMGISAPDQMTRNESQVKP